MNNSWLYVKEFENQLCKFTGSPFCVTIDSCTNAIFLSLIYCKCNKLINGKQIIIPEQTYISVPMQVKNAGLIPIFKPLKWHGYYRLGNTNIIDSAQIFKKNMFIPSSLQCISFQYKKHLPIGRGGAILTDNADVYNWLIKARHDGRNMYEDYGNIKNVNNVGYHCPLLPHEAIRGQELLLNTNLTCNNIPGCYSNYNTINTNIFNENYNNRL